jgi:ribosomal protein S18 acetylase RimI-like enzyme
LIRRARDDDWPGARALWREADELHAKLAPAYFCAPAREPHEWRALLASEHTAVFVAEAERPDAGDAAGALAGLACVHIYDTPPDPAMVPRRRGHVETLVVRQAHRRRGVAEQLMRHVSSWAREQRAVELVLTVWSGNEAAEAFYASLGYTELSRVLHKTLS